VESSWFHSVRRPLIGLLWLWRWRIWWNEDWQGKPKYSEKTLPSATLFTTNSTWPDQGSNPGRHGGKPATNRLSYGAALFEGYSVSEGLDTVYFDIDRQSSYVAGYYLPCLISDRDISWRIPRGGLVCQFRTGILFKNCGMREIPTPNTGNRRKSPTSLW
jgi:hypothetical protein